MPALRPIPQPAPQRPPAIDVVSILSRNASPTVSAVPTSTHGPDTYSHKHDESLDFYDEFVLFDLRLWMVIAAISGLVTTMVRILLSIT